jgi:hypothetical protein
MHEKRGTVPAIEHVLAAPAVHSQPIKCSCLAYRCNSAVISIRSIDNCFLKQQEWLF